MGLIFMDSFEHYVTMTQKGYSGGNTNIAGRHGRGCLVAPIRILPSPTSTLSLGRAVYPDSVAATTFIHFKSSGNTTLLYAEGYGDGRLIVGTTKPFGLKSSPSSLVLPARQWHFIELWGNLSLIDPGPPKEWSLSYTLRINETTALSGSFIVDSASYDAGTFDWIQTFDSIDDLWITDGELLGDCHARSYYAEADGTYSDFTPSTPGTHYVLIDETSPNSTDYLEATVIGQQESHNYPASDDEEIMGVQPVLYVEAGALSKYKSLLRSGGVDVLGDEKTAASNYGFQPYRTSPFTAVDFTMAEVSGMEFGAEATG